MKSAQHLMSESSSLLDKRIVAKLLLTYFERNQAGGLRSFQGTSNGGQRVSKLRP
jgi:hypothetical protein